MRDPYEILGVDKSATQDDIKSAFRKLAAKHHPDRNPGDSGADERFKQLNAAYQILSDPQRRAAYDRYGEAAFDPARAGGAGGPFQGMPFDVQDLHFDGLFGDLLGALGIKTGGRPVLQKEVRLTFEEAAFGCTKDVKYDRNDTCDGCAGSGSAPGTAPERCATCGGRGRIRIEQALLPIAMERPCARCSGTGRIVSNPCPKCRGAGLCSRTRTLEVTIPPGVENGATRLVEGAGNVPVPGRPAGDLELVFRVEEHPFFRRVGDDLVCSMPISFPTAALGGEVEVPTLEGKGLLRIPPGTQSGTVLRVRGKGIPRRRMGGRGDQLVEVVVEVPTQVSEHQKELLLDLAKSFGDNVQPQQATFMEKLKNLFG